MRQVFHRAIEPFLFHDARGEATGHWRAAASRECLLGLSKVPIVGNPSAEMRRWRYAKRARWRRSQPWRAINSSSQAAERGQQPSQADAERRGCWHRQWRALARSGRRLAGSRAFGGGASPMAAGASPARSRVLSPPRVLAPEEARPELAPPLSINLSYGCQAGDGAAAVPIQHLLYTKKYLKVVWNNWAAVF